MYDLRLNTIVSDIRSGMYDNELMKKHGLSSRGLRMVMQMLVEKNAFEQSELSELSPSYREIAKLVDSRRSPRVYVPVPIAFKVHCHETGQIGYVRDISRGGIRVAGIRVQVGQELTLSMPLREVGPGGPVEFRAVCRWCAVEGKRKKYVVGGFEIVDISAKASARLYELIDFISLQVERQEATLRTSLSDSGLFELRRAVGADKISRDFSGTLDGVDILEVVQLLLLNGRKVLLSIQSSEGLNALLHLRDGRIVHATHGELDGVEAFYAGMSFVGGQFKTLPWSEPPQETIDVPSEFLLLEAARRRDDPGSGMAAL
ncbi:MAG: DUF4388 domain-containing protein [Desulfomonile sp.]|nr:DUF4388 domain-containing protein [Desulfomonile sp.]